jgi:hypothetical protein
MEKTMISIRSTLGPNPYVPGGFAVTFGEFHTVRRAVVVCDQSQILEANDTAYSIHVTIATNVVTILVFSAATAGGGPNAWAQIGGLNLSPRTFTVYAEGE